MSKIDPILLSVYARTFKSITDEMSISMQQTTRSPILCEAKDLSLIHISEPTRPY